MFWVLRALLLASCFNYLTNFYNTKESENTVIFFLEVNLFTFASRTREAIRANRNKLNRFSDLQSNVFSQGRWTRTELRTTLARRQRVYGPPPKTWFAGYATQISITIHTGFIRSLFNIIPEFSLSQNNFCSDCSYYSAIILLFIYLTNTRKP